MSQWLPFNLNFAFPKGSQIIHFLIKSLFSKLNMTYKLSSSFSDFPREFSERAKKKVGGKQTGFHPCGFPYYISRIYDLSFRSSSSSKVDENNFVDVKTHLAKSPEQQKMRHEQKRKIQSEEMINLVWKARFLNRTDKMRKISAYYSRVIDPIELYDLQHRFYDVNHFGRKYQIFNTSYPNTHFFPEI